MKRSQIFDLVFIILLAVGGIVLAGYSNTIFHNELWPFFPLILLAYFIGKWVGRQSRSSNSNKAK